MRYLFLPIGLLFLAGCARLTAVQVNDIDQTRALTTHSTAVHIRLDQNVLNSAAVGQTLAQTGNSKVAAAAALAFLAARLSTGDEQGRIVLRSEISGQVDWLALQEQACPGGYITNLRSINEYDDYIYWQNFNFGFDADCIQPAAAATDAAAPNS